MDVTGVYFGYTKLNHLKWKQEGKKCVHHESVYKI